MRRAARVDDNQPSVVAMLRKVPGLTVAVTSAVGQGFPDFIIGYKSRNFLIELKDGSKVESKRKLTTNEETWHKAWTGQVSVCKSFDEIWKVIN